jgi:hypothetical protein
MELHGLTPQQAAAFKLQKLLQQTQKHFLYGTTLLKVKHIFTMTVFGLN